MLDSIYLTQVDQITVIELELSRFVDFSRLVNFEKSSTFLLASTNRQNTRSAAFHGRESIKHIIRLFSKAA